MKRTAWLVGVWLVAGCASAPPTPAELDAADYGRPMSQEQGVEAARAFLEQFLKDPASADIKWGAFGQGCVREAPIYGRKLRCGYILDASINAKNSYGGYTGYKSYQFVLFNGTLLSAYGPQETVLNGRVKEYTGKIY